MSDTYKRNYNPKSTVDKFEGLGPFACYCDKDEDGCVVAVEDKIGERHAIGTFPSLTAAWKGLVHALTGRSIENMSFSGPREWSGESASSNGQSRSGNGGAKVNLYGLLATMAELAGFDFTVETNVDALCFGDNVASESAAEVVKSAIISAQGRKKAQADVGTQLKKLRAERDRQRKGRDRLASLGVDTAEADALINAIQDRIDELSNTVDAS